MTQQNRTFCDVDFYKALAIKEILQEDEVTAQYGKIPDREERERLLAAHVAESAKNPGELIFVLPDPQLKKDKFTGQIFDDSLRTKKIKNTNSKRIPVFFAGSDHIASLPVGYVQD